MTEGANLTNGIGNADAVLFFIMIPELSMDRPVIDTVIGMSQDVLFQKLLSLTTAT